MLIAGKTYVVYIVIAVDETASLLGLFYSESYTMRGAREYFLS